MVKRNERQNSVVKKMEWKMFAESILARIFEEQQELLYSPRRRCLILV
jgi:hypothetical protein